MLKFSWLAAAAVTVLAACAGNQTTQSQASPANVAAAPPAPQTPPMTSAQAAPPQAATPETGTYTDAQLRSFATASRDINPLNRQLATATPQQHATLVAQIRDALQRNNIDSTTYNAIAAQAQADPTLASRIAAMSPTTPSSG